MSFVAQALGVHDITYDTYAIWNVSLGNRKCRHGRKNICIVLPYNINVEFEGNWITNNNKMNVYENIYTTGVVTYELATPNYLEKTGMTYRHTASRRGRMWSQCSSPRSTCPPRAAAGCRMHVFASCCRHRTWHHTRPRRPTLPKNRQLMLNIQLCHDKQPKLYTVAEEEKSCVG